MKNRGNQINTEISTREKRDKNTAAREGTPHPVDVQGKRKRPYEVFSDAKSGANLTMDVAKDAVRRSHQDYDTYKAYSNLPSVKRASWVQNQPSPFAQRAKRVKMKPGMATESTTSLADRILGEGNKASSPVGKVVDKLRDVRFRMKVPGGWHTSVKGNLPKSVSSQSNFKAGRSPDASDYERAHKNVSWLNLQHMSEAELTEAKAKLGSGARFKLLKKKLKTKGAKTPGALAAWIGRKKFGRAKFGKLSAHGKHTYTESKDSQVAKISALAESLIALRSAVIGE
jgi:hypothetical protein